MIYFIFHNRNYKGTVILCIFINLFHMYEYLMISFIFLIILFLLIFTNFQYGYKLFQKKNNFNKYICIQHVYATISRVWTKCIDRIHQIIFFAFKTSSGKYINLSNLIRKAQSILVLSKQIINQNFILFLFFILCSSKFFNPFKYLRMTVWSSYK